MKENGKKEKEMAKAFSLHNSNEYAFMLQVESMMVIGKMIEKLEEVNF